MTVMATIKPTVIMIASASLAAARVCSKKLNVSCLYPECPR